MPARHRRRPSRESASHPKDTGRGVKNASSGWGSSQRSRQNPTVGISGRPLGRFAATLLGIALVAGTAALLIPFRARNSTATAALALVVPVVVAAWAGGRIAALITACVAAGTLEVLFLPPYNTFKLDLVEDAIALGVFTAVALAVGTLVASEGERRRVAEERANEIARLYEQQAKLLDAQARLTEEAQYLQQLGDDRS